MGLRVTTFLLIANIFVFFWIIRVQETEDYNIEEDDYFLLLGSRSLDVDKLEILKRNVGVESYEPSIVLNKERDRWFIETPVKWPANFHAVNSIINQIKYLQKDVSFEVSDILSRGQTLKDYGLSQPGMIIKVFLNDKEMVLKVGAPTELENKFYLLGPREKNIYVLSGSIIESLDVDVKDIRDPEIFNVQNYEIDVLQLEQKGETAQSKVRIERDENNWRIQLPILANADNAQVDRVVQQLLMTRVDQFVEQNVSPTQAEFVVQHQILIEGNQNRQKLVLGTLTSDDSSALYGKLEGWDLLFTVNSSILDLISNAQERLRDRSLLALDAGFVHSVDIVQNELLSKLSLRKLENGEWQVIYTEKDVEIASLRAEKDVILQLIEELNNLKVEEFVTDAPTNDDLIEFGLAKPPITVSLNDGEVLTLSFGNLLIDENEILVKLGDKPSVYGVDDSVLETLNTAYLYYRNREIDTLPSGASIIDIEIRDMISNEVVLYQHINRLKTNDNQRENTVLTAEQRMALDSLVSELRAFRVESIISDQFEEVFTGQYGNRSPWRFELKLRVLLPGGVDDNTIQEKVYFFTRRLGGSLQGGASQGKNLTFELQQDTIDSLYKLVFERKLPEDYRNPSNVPSSVSAGS